LLFTIQLIYLKFNRPYPWICRSRFRSVGVATQLYTWRCGAQMSLVARDFSSPKRQDMEKDGEDQLDRSREK
jgi:hypothetical protein